MPFIALPEPCPLRAEGLQIEETDSDVIVFGASTNEFHLLNRVAYAILQASNGVTTPAAIATAISHTFDLEGRSLTAIANDVDVSLRDLHARGLVAFVAGVPAARTGPDATSADTSSDDAAATAWSSGLFAVALDGTSMFPTLLPGERVVASAVSWDDLQVGEIVIFAQADGVLVAHRVISKEAAPVRRLITKGDTVPDPDAPVGWDQVIGKVRAVLRGGSVQWMRTVDAGGRVAATKMGGFTLDPSVHDATDDAGHRVGSRGLKVLDLVDMPADAVRELRDVEDVALVLLSPRNAFAWAEVASRDVRAVLSIPDGFRVYTGQPELTPEMLAFLERPLRLVVSGQLFLCACEPDDLSRALEAVILNGEAYVGSIEAKAALEARTTIVSGAIHVVPRHHARWIGDSLLGPEFEQAQPDTALVAIGTLARSPRLDAAVGLHIFHEARTGGASA